MKLYTFIILSLLFSLSFFASAKQKKAEKDVVRTRLDENITKMKGCYNKALNKSTKGFDFISILNFEIDKNGKSQNIVVKSSKKIEDSQFFNISTCIKNIVKEISFSKPLKSKLVKVSQPINFYQNH